MPDDSLDQVAAEVRVCPQCDLSKSRTKAVPGEGPADAKVMFVGEGPGFHEDQQGRPFVGAAGKFLDELLASAGLQREQVFITNVIKCRPPANRDPYPDEITACAPYLKRQIAVINPQVIVTLGRHSMEWFLPGEKISRIHGLPRKVGGRVIVPMYHPAAALHQPKYKADIEEDFRKLPKILKEAEQVQDSESPPSAQQLSLF